MQSLATLWKKTSMTVFLRRVMLRNNNDKTLPKEN